MNAEAKKKEDEGQMVVAQKGELISVEIDQAKKAGMNLLLPSTHIENMSEFHSPVIDYVELSPEPADGDVYYHSESKKMVPSKQGLVKLAVCAGIMWDMSLTKRTDNRESRDYVSFRAVGGVRKADGTVVPFSAEYDMDFEVIENKLRDQYEKSGKKAKKTGDELQSYVDYCVKRDLLYKREHKLKLCESGAMNRVIRSLLGLKAGYTKQELTKPFVVARIVFRPDYSDPEIRRIMVQKSIESITSVYGGSNDQMPITTAPPIEIPHDADNNNSDVVDGKIEDPMQEEDNKQEDTMSHKKADFDAADEKGQIDTLKAMAKRKGYDLKQLKKPLEDFVESEREGFFDKLMECADSDLPF